MNKGPVQSVPNSVLKLKRRRSPPGFSLCLSSDLGRQFTTASTRATSSANETISAFRCESPSVFGFGRQLTLRGRRTAFRHQCAYGAKFFASHWLFLPMSTETRDRTRYPRARLHRDILFERGGDRWFGFSFRVITPRFRWAVANVLLFSLNFPIWSLNGFISSMAYADKIIQGMF